MRSHTTDQWTPCRSRSIKNSLSNRGGSRMERIEFEDSCSDSNRWGSYNNDNINQSMLPVDEEQNAAVSVGSLKDMRGKSQK